MPLMTPELKKAVEEAGDAPVTLSDPETQRSFVLLPLDEYERLVGWDYDDSPWTDEETEALADEAQRSLDGRVAES